MSEVADLHYPFGQKIDTSKPVCPEEFLDMYLSGKAIRRYVYTEGSYDHIFSDTVYDHIRRCVWCVDYLDLPGWIDRQKIQRILWIHDLPEIHGLHSSEHDITSVDKQKNPQLAKYIASQEYACARALFSEPDLWLYDDFEAAASAFKWKIDISSQHFSYEACVARMIDIFFEGIQNFHYFTTRWFCCDDFRAKVSIPTLACFVYGFTTGLDLYQKTFDLEDQTMKYLIQFLLKQYHFLFIQEMWNEVPADRIPADIQKMYDLFVSRMEAIVT